MVSTHGDGGLPSKVVLPSRDSPHLLSGHAVPQNSHLVRKIFF